MNWLLILVLVAVVFLWLAALKIPERASFTWGWTALAILATCEFLSLGVPVVHGFFIR